MSNPIGKRLLIICLLVSVTSLIAHPVLAVSSAHYRYQVPNPSDSSDGDLHFDYWFSTQGVRTDIKFDQREVSTIYSQSEDSLIILDHAGQTATKMSREGIRAMKKKIEKATRKMQQQMKNMPPKQRKRMKEMMGNNVPSLDKEKVPEGDPEFTGDQQVEWNGMAARRGHFVMDGDTKGTMTLLEESPVTIDGGEKATLKQFQSLMKEMIQMGGQMSGVMSMSSFTDRLATPGNFLGPMQFRMAEIDANGQNLKLTRWERKSVPASHFGVPSGYETNDAFNRSSRSGTQQPRRGY